MDPKHEFLTDPGGIRAADVYTLIITAKLNNVDPRAWLADVLRRIADYPTSRLHELLPWNYVERTHQNTGLHRRKLAVVHDNT